MVRVLIMTNSSDKELAATFLSKQLLTLEQFGELARFDATYSNKI